MRMSPQGNDFPPPVNYISVDFENVREIDPPVIGSKTVSFTRLLLAKQTWLEVAHVGKLLAHAAVVQLVRLPEDLKTWSVSLELPRDLDVHNAPEIRHPEISGLINATNNVAKLGEEFLELCGGGTTETWQVGRQ